MKAILIPGIAVLLLAAATVAPAAAHIVQWHEAHAVYDAAIARADEAADKAKHEACEANTDAKEKSDNCGCG